MTIVLELLVRLALDDKEPSVLRVDWTDAPEVGRKTEAVYGGGPWPRFKVTKVLVDGEEKEIK